MRSAEGSILFPGSMVAIYTVRGIIIVERPITDELPASITGFIPIYISLLVILLLMKVLKSFIIGIAPR